jgi:hypothetical protein
MSTKETKTRTTVRATKEVKPKMPKMDKAHLFETHTRALFTVAVEDWCKENIEGKVEKEVKGAAVDDLQALFGSALDTTVSAMTACYLDAAFEDDDDEEEEEDEEEEDGDEDVIDADFEEA